MRLFVDTGLPALATDFEKVIVGLIVNKCKLVEIPATPDAQGNPTWPQGCLDRAKQIPYYTDLRW